METYYPYINNQWISTSQIKTIFSPYDHSPVGDVHFCHKNEIEMALNAAQKKFQTFKYSSRYERIQILEQLKSLVEANSDDLAHTIMREGGKPIRFARNEVFRATITIQSAIDVLRTMSGEILPLDIAPQTTQYSGRVERFPLGIIVGITPFNFPLNLVMHKVAPAIAMGNTIIIKPASQTPVTALKLARLFSNIPDTEGILQVLPMNGKNAELLYNDSRVQFVSFTGSPDVGWQIKKNAYKKKVTLELGGNAAAIVCNDADLDFAIPRLVTGSMAHAGQVCISVQRIFVQENIFDSFLQEFSTAVKNSAIYGDPADEKVIVGPIIENTSLQRIADWVESAVKSGAQLVTGGKKDAPFYIPTVLTHTLPNMEINYKEVFGPVVSVEPFRNIKEAILKVNNSRYGLQAGIFTTNISYIEKAYREIECGGIIVNDYPTFRIDPMPYGGVKESGFGREGLKYAMEEMSEIKLLAIRH